MAWGWPMSDDMVAPAAGRPSLSQRLRDLLKQRDVSGMVTAVVIKVMVLTLNFTLITLAARALDPSAFGYYSILFSAASLLYIVAAVGQEPFVLRIWNEMKVNADAPRLKGALLFTFVASVCGSLIATAIFYPWALTYVGHGTALATLAYLVISSPLQICIHLVRTERGTVYGDGLSFAIVGLPPIVYLGMCLVNGTPADIADIFTVLACGAFVALLAQLVMIRRRILALFPDFRTVRAIVEFRQWLPRSGKLWMTASLEATNQYIDVIIIGFLLDPTVAGAYFVTVRFANLFAAAADAVNLFATQHLPALYYRDERAALAKMLDNLAWIMAFFTGMGLLGITAGGYLALWVINENYTQYYPQLLILCLGTAAAGTTRASTLALMLSGHEGRYLLITAMGVLLRCLALFALVPHFGITGAVIASTLIYAIQAVAFRRADKALTGLDASMFRLLRKRPVPE